jgi:prepilin-type N-terminal cleavage/methylation domain-containing protein
MSQKILLRYQRAFRRNKKKREGTKMKMKKKFTLIELLVVIGVIAILAAMLLPAIGKVREHARKTQARAQMKSLEIAIKSYETTYGLLPWDDGDTIAAGIQDSEWDDVPTDGSSADAIAYDTLLQILTQVDITDSANSNAATPDLSPDAKLQGNTRQIRFIDAPEKFESKSFVDPWGNRFVICLDFTYDGKVSIGGVDVNRSVAIYSFGPDKNDDNGVKSGSDKDDLASWTE